MEFSAEFTVIGEDQEEDGSDLAPVKPGDVFPIDQDLYEEEGQKWNRPGDPVGEAHGSMVLTRRHFASCTITFTFGEDDTLVAHGLLPVDGRKLRDGKLAVTGGTGQFHGAGGRVNMETQNPKRWSFII